MVSVKSSKEEKIIPWPKVLAYIGDIENHLDELF